jgi:ATP-dependent protease ClpP protease subunit
MGLKKESDEGTQMYEKYLKERKIFIYNNVSVESGETIKNEYNVLQEFEGPSEDE